ncbi:MAG: choice-of-anchor D domain-containing protein, partial [Desulfobacteraceae bacterium]|nr:choice-of-anchor D domain-containing protein [Desulfobacteraceae bacterium]
PEIDVQGAGVTIDDGDTTPSAVDDTEFGEANISNGSVEKEFTIKNNGTRQLSLSGTPLVMVSGVNAADFSVISFPDSTIAAAGSTTFTVRFDPGNTGPRSATLTIGNDDSNENPYNFSIQGTGTTPEINVQGNSVTITDGDTTASVSDHTDFGSADITAGTVNRTFTIENLGSSSLTLSGSPLVAVGGTNSADFSIVSNPASQIASGGSATFTVRFDPSQSGQRTATLSIANNDSDENPYNFNIKGTGSSAPEIDVQGAGVTIDDGDTTPSAVDDTEFGEANISNGSVEKEFTIKNNG